jgi:hypothetical protein
MFKISKILKSTLQAKETQLSLQNQKKTYLFSVNQNLLKIPKNQNLKI